MGLFVVIKFNNWESYNKRAKEYKNPVWFSFSNDFAVNKNFHSFSDQERLIFIYLLCEASKENKNGNVSIDIDHFCYITKQKNNIVLLTIKKLINKQILTLNDPVTIPTGSPHDPNLAPTEQNRTEQNNNTSSKTVAIAPEFNLDILYQSYPRKIGKQVGLKNLAKIIMSDKDYQEFKLAIKNYSSLVLNEDKKYIKHFSSFVGTKTGNQPWRDFIEMHPEQKKSKIIKMG